MNASSEKADSRITEALLPLIRNPAAFGREVGFELLTDSIHAQWIRDMVSGVGDMTLQAHRGSYKTTCVSVGMSVIMITSPRLRIAFIRKTDNDVKEVLRQARKILEHPVTAELTRRIWGKHVELTKATTTEITTNLSADVKGTAQLTGIGTGGSLTGKHYDVIFTDDIVNVQDRVSRAERERVKLIYQELQNIRNRGGRIFNTGTPWHEDDAFSIMPEPRRYDCYSTGLIDPETLSEIKASMLPSLFAANYELRHIAAEDVIFTDPQTGAEPSLIDNAQLCHIDAAYDGEDYTAFTIARKADGKIYVLGKLWRKHVGQCEDEAIRLRRQFRAGAFWVENNSDRGYLAKELRSKGETAVDYNEDMNKFIKISTYLLREWKRVVFVRGTDEAYVKQICDFTQDAEHDDAPDSLAVCVRRLFYAADAGQRTPGIYRGLPPA